MFSSNPPVVIFSPSRRLRDNSTKHSLQNVKEVPEVVINIVTYDMVQQVSLSSCEYPKGTDEFIKAGFTKQMSTMVKPPMVKESKAKLECKVIEIKPLGENGGAGQLVIAEVLCVHINDELLTANKEFNQEKLELVARLGADWYAKISPSNLFRVEKPNTRLGIGIDALPVEIKNSKILTGNNLAQLANMNTMPSSETGFFDNKLAELNNSGKENNTLSRVHAYVKELLDEGKVSHAWQVLLASSKGNE
jgi:flavin reductase (DIM6/NTAB) family NADH-FMN oxidoreductase RutF